MSDQYEKAIVEIKAIMERLEKGKIDSRKAIEQIADIVDEVNFEEENDD